LMITGHSAGAAMGTLMVYDILTTYPEYNIQYLVTFGSPRVGNQHFVDHLSSYHVISYRITHHYDIVPHVPEELVGFQHVSEEVWYNEQNTEYKICADTESASCSDSCAPLHCTSTSDHINYMGMNMGSGNC